MEQVTLNGNVTAVRDVPVRDLRLWDRNPRSITKQKFAALVRSLEADPAMMQARPVIALPDGRVVAGNMRLRAALELGWETVPTVYADLDETRATTWALRDNNPYGEWDETLAELLGELERAEVDLSLTGFADIELQHLLASLEPPPEDRGVDLALADVSVGDPRHTCERGDRWQVGPHLLVVEPVYDGWQRWVGLLEPDDLLVPYPTPTLPLTVKAKKHRLLMIQPDPWLAGHVIDKFAAVAGEDAVTKLTG